MKTILLVLTLVLLSARRHTHHKDKIKNTHGKHRHDKKKVKKEHRLKKSRRAGCDMDKESLCGEEGQKILSVSSLNQGSDCFVGVNYCDPAAECKFNSMHISREGNLVTMDGNAKSESNKKCVWIGVSTSSASFFIHIAIKLNNEEFLAVFKKLLSSPVDYDYILTKLDDIGMGGLFISDLTMMGGMDIQNIDLYDGSTNGRYDPSSTFQGFPMDEDYKAMAAGKQPTGIYTRRAGGNDPHHQRITWGRRLRHA